MRFGRKVMMQAAGLFLFLLIVPSLVFADTVTTIEPDGVDVGYTAYEIFQKSKLGGGPVDGPHDIEHIFETNVGGLGTVFQFHANQNGDYDGSNLDRQRVELKAYNSSNADVKGLENEVMTYHWQFRVMPTFQMSPAGAFNHIFQLKAQGGDDGAPILTFTVADDKLYFRHSPIGATMDEVEVLASTDWSNVSNKWLDATVTVENSEVGLLEMTLKDLSDGTVLMEYSGHKDNWRDEADINRPKWGIYRKIFRDMGDADIQFAKFEITKHSNTNGITHDVDLNKDNHIEAEQYFSKQGLSFRQTTDTNRFNDAYMETPEAWNVSEESNQLTYKVNVSNSSGTVYIHLLGKAPDADASDLKLFSGETSTNANVKVGSWGWTTVEIPLMNGEQSIAIQALDAGVMLDKFVINQSPTAPASATILKLDQITLDGQPLPGFSPSVFEYKVNLPLGISVAPTVEAVASPELNAVIGAEQPDTERNSPSGKVAIVVTDSADHSLTAEYSIVFNYMRYESAPPDMVIYPVVKATGTPNMTDGDITTLWDNKPPGGDDNNANDKYSEVTLDLGETQPLKHAFIAFDLTNNNDSFKFDLLVSEDGESYTSVFADGPKWSNGNESGFQQFTFEESPARYVIYRGYAGKKKNGSGSLEKYNKVREILFAGDSKLDYDKDLYELDLTTNTSHQISLTLTNADGSTNDVTSLATYQTANESVASVDENGFITAIANGSTVTEATYGLHTKPINIIVGDAVIISPPTWPSGSKAQDVSKYEDGVFLTWTAAESELGIKNYRIIDTDTNDLLAEVGNVLNTVISGLNEATQYNITIQAVDMGGTMSILADGPKLTFFTEGGSPEPEAPDPEGTIIFEAEDIVEAGQYVLEPNDLKAKFNSESGASGGRNFQIDFGEETGQSAEFTTNVTTTGAYEILYGYKMKPSRGIFQLSINGEPFGEPVDHYGPDGYVWTNLGSYTFESAGEYTFKFEIVGKNPDSSSLGFVFDYIKLIPESSEEPGSGGSGVDILDPDFINEHGGVSVSIDADSTKSPYDVFGAAFGTDNPVEGATKTARSSPKWGEEVAEHVANFYDEDLGKEVFKVEVGGNDCFTCYLHNTTYDSATDTFTGGNNDRQRIEIRPGENSDLIGLENDITAYNWKLKLDKDLPRPSGFFHIFQYKAVNATGDVSSFDTYGLHDSANYPNFESDEDGNPILTLTVSSSATQKLEFRYADIGSEAGQETLASIPVDDIRDRWVEVTVKILNSESGWVTMTMKDVETNEILMEYNDPDRILDMWRRPEIKYNGKTFEGPYPSVYNMLNRPKWGIYRKADKTDNNVQDAKIYLADMTLYKSAVGVSPVNLAYGKDAYNIGSTSGNEFQLANAIPERLTDGVQTDPVVYDVSAVPADNFAALGKLTWIGTESSKKGNVIIDLGEKMDFNQVKLFATERLKNVDVWISDDIDTHTGADFDSVDFIKVDDLYTDDKGTARTFYNETAGSNNAVNKDFLIDLGKTYSSRYVKFFFENGGGSNGANSDKTAYSMTGPVRISELEIYNAPQTPKNIAINYTSGSEATITWDDVPADYFVIYDQGKPFIETVNSNRYHFTSLDPGALYQLSVRTVYTDPYSFKPMLSAESETIQIQTNGDPIIPNPPTSVTASAASDKSIDVSWEAVSDAQSYRVALATDAFERIVADEYKGTSYTINDLSPGTLYTVKVYSIRRGTLSAATSEDQVTTSGIKNASDNLLFNKEVQYSRVWNDDRSSYGGQQALDNDVDDSRWVGIKGSATAWLMVDIGEVTPVNVLEYYSFQNKLKQVSFYYAIDGEAFTDPDSDKWIKILTDDREEQGKFGDPGISAIAESITLDTPVNARFIKFTVDEVDGDINVNEVKAFGPANEHPGENPGDGGSNSSPTPDGSTPSKDNEIIVSDDGSVVVKLEAKANQSSVIASISAETLNEAAELATADAKGLKNIVLELPLTDNVNEYAVELPVQTLLSKDNEYKITLATPAGNIELPGNMLNTAGLASMETATVSIAKVDRSTIESSLLEQIGDHPVIDLAIFAGDRRINWNNPGAPATITIDYEPSAEELLNHEHIVVWYIDENGEITPIPNGKYDPATGKVTFVTTHFSRYAVSYVNKTFTDLSSVPWAVKEIEVLASKGVIKGVSVNAYSPSANITRADFVTLLVRGLELSATIQSNFADIQQSDYYYETVGIAKMLGITNGTGNHLFNPQEQITREDMMVLIARALEVTNRLSNNDNQDVLAGYNDEDQIMDYAREGIADLIRAGIVEGNQQMINPKDNATRAETAVMIYRILNL